MFFFQFPKINIYFRFKNSKSVFLVPKNKNVPPIDFRYVLDHVWWKKLVEASRNGYPDDVPTLNNSAISMTKKGKFYLVGEELKF